MLNTRINHVYGSAITPGIVAMTCWTKKTCSYRTPDFPVL